MRFLGIAALLASLAVTQVVSAQPLAPGKPAGVQEARRGANTGIWIAGAVLAAGLVAVMMYTNEGNNNGVVITSPTTATP